ncbi:hypothetical protein F7725_022494 [Dissostichus mawsoni]|uniref:Uncharacterized protein n=1 Tax=Dissostichus mawsoni TaxID=36200 RepID=A0A7J5Z064_DISMA|nr:hypothetical protein F7725_022494 [Dissostichus mawsoni]
MFKTLLVLVASCVTVRRGSSAHVRASGALVVWGNVVERGPRGAEGPPGLCEDSRPREDEPPNDGPLGRCKDSRGGGLATEEWESGSSWALLRLRRGLKQPRWSGEQRRGFPQTWRQHVTPLPLSPPTLCVLLPGTDVLRDGFQLFVVEMHPVGQQQEELAGFKGNGVSSSSCDACAAVSAGSLPGRSLTSPWLYSAVTKSMAWSLGMLRWTEWGGIGMDSENMITVQEDRATFVCSTRIHNGEPTARTSCRARVRPDSA